MTPGREDPPPRLRPLEDAAALALGERLRAERPLPGAAFRGDLRRRLIWGPPEPRPQRLGLRIGAFGGAGLVLLALAAASAAGLGPLGG